MSASDLDLPGRIEDAIKKAERFIAMNHKFRRVYYGVIVCNVLSAILASLSPAMPSEPFNWTTLFVSIVAGLNVGSAAFGTFHGVSKDRFEKACACKAELESLQLEVAAGTLDSGTLIEKIKQILQKYSEVLEHPDVQNKPAFEHK